MTEPANSTLQSVPEPSALKKALMLVTINDGKSLRKQREERNLTQYELADLANCSQPIISQIELGRRKASLSLAESIYRVLNPDK